MRQLVLWTWRLSHKALRVNLGNLLPNSYVYTPEHTVDLVCLLQIPRL